MTVHVVQQGECLSSIAHDYGLPDWKQLHEHPANTELKKKRPNPNILAPGDQVVVPDRTLKTAPAATGRTHVFKVHLRKVRLRVALVTRSGKPYEGKRYIVNVGTRTITGKTGSGGMIDVEVPVTESAARLRAWLVEDDENAIPTIDRNLSIGHMDPIETMSGVRGRLSNLGFLCPISDEAIEDLNDRTLAAVRAFRLKNDLPDITQPGASDKTEPGSEPASEDQKEPSKEEITKYVEQMIDAAFREKLRVVYEASAAS